MRRTLALAREAGQGNSVLHSLLSAQDAGELSEQQLIDEESTLLLAGHETTALALTYTLALLADAPAEQAAARDEVAWLPAPHKAVRPRLLPSITARPKDPLPMRVERTTARAGSARQTKA